MKRTTCLLCIAIIAFLMVACNTKKEKTVTQELEQLASEIEDLPKGTTSPKKIFLIESGYVKYKTSAAGMDMTRELWFDNYGTRQLDENYMDIMGTKAGGFSIINNGYMYKWDYNKTEGSKIKYYAAEATNYDNISKEDIDKYGIEKHGYEQIAGVKCLKVTTQKPVKATVWVYEGVPMKTISEFAGNEVKLEAIEANFGKVDASKFDIPTNVVFTELQ